MLCGFPSSSTTKSSLLRSPTILPFLSRTVVGTFTTFTLEENVVGSSALPLSAASRTTPHASRTIIATAAKRSFTSALTPLQSPSFVTWARVYTLLTRRRQQSQLALRSKMGARHATARSHRTRDLQEHLPLHRRG